MVNVSGKASKQGHTRATLHSKALFQSVFVRLLILLIVSSSLIEDEDVSETCADSEVDCDCVVMVVIVLA